MFADIELTIGERPLPSVPKTAGFEQNGKLHAFVVGSGILQQRVIAVEPSVGENFPVKLGIRERERVVLVHDPSLSTGQRVKYMQWLARICVKRPVFATVLMLVVLVLGALGYRRLGIDQFPNIDIPVVVITTVLPGAAPEEVETDLTDKI